MYTDWSQDAFWKKTMMTHEAYIATAAEISVLTLMPGWQLQRTRLDSMHIVNLGISWYLIGNVLWWLVTQGPEQKASFASAHAHACMQ